MNFETQYYNALKSLLTFGKPSNDRTGVGTIKGQQYFIIEPVKYGLPILKGKKIIPKNAWIELVWMLRGYTNIKFLEERGVNYWKQWADENGDLGPVYGKLLRNFNGIDQIQYVIDTLIKDPDSRRICMSLWSPRELEEQKLTPCYSNYQFTSYLNSVDKRVLDLHITQRSGDSFLGVPYDAIGFSLLLILISTITNMKIGTLHYTINDFHLYQNHIDCVNQYFHNFEKDPKHLLNFNYDTAFSFDMFSLEALKYLRTNNQNNIDVILDALSEQYYDFVSFDDYESYPLIKAKVAV